MTHDGNRPHRRSIRLGGYDYSQAGAYFVTICTDQRVSFLGHIDCGEMRISPAGLIVQEAWAGLPVRFPPVDLDAFVIMPNHIHGIVLLDKATGVMNHAPTHPNPDPIVGAQFIAPEAPIAAPEATGVMNNTPTISEIIRALKAVSTRRVRQLAHEGFGWQRNYYEHIVRNEAELNRIRQYVADNPLNWATDQENPEGHPSSPGQEWQV